MDKNSRKYGLSCLPCRRRKIRCNSKRPACDACTRSGEPCIYRAPDASASRLSNALERSEARVAELQEALREASSKNRQGSEGRDVSSSDDAGRTSLSIDENGAVQYYGATSRFYVAPIRTQDSQDAAATKTTVDEAYHRRWLLSNARFQKSWDRAVYANLGASNDIDADAASTLLQIYWTWQAPLHNCVYRRCFTRDMAVGGPYFSPFLLNVIYAHACRHAKPDDQRFTRYNNGEFFLQKAKLLLLEEIDQERPRIPTIQGLLILGGRQCAVGKNSQGWLYTGMAITMLKHLGFHLPKARGSSLETLEPDDLEAQKRLYLSAYAWDKSISLTLGRVPSLTDMPYHPMSLFDTSDDSDEWRPFYLTDHEGESEYPPTSGYNTTTFSYFCEQSKIINEMYDTVYNRKSDRLDSDVVVALERKFRAFYKSLPHQIRLDDIDSLPCCPPPHIFCLNILYHTALILLYRPFLNIPTPSSTAAPQSRLVRLAHQVCAEEAAKVGAFFRAYGRTFWFRNQTYLTSYCVYTAATIEVQQVRHPDPEVSAAAVERLATTLRMLEVECMQTPGIRRSVDIIKAQLGAQTASHVEQAQQLGSDSEGLRASDVHGFGAMTIPALLDIGRPEVGIQATAARASTFQCGETGLDSALVSDAVPSAVTDIDGNGLLPDSWLDWYIPDASGGFVLDVDGWQMTTSL